jgi:DNA-binding winged helix-turn-helix (wHTH) protein/Tol biopolymer transport system component
MEDHLLQAERQGRLAKFGAFELDRHTGELRKHGIKIRLQTKPFQILLALLETPGEFVTREELQRRLWLSDTFVDFESGLNTAANRLRLALGDSADSPRYIETLPRSGYRFIAPVQEIEPMALVEIRTKPEQATEGVPIAQEPRSADLKPWLIGLAVACALLLAALIFQFRKDGARTEPVLKQITFRRGTVFNARFAPDGESILYSAKWNSGTHQIYMASLVSPESRPLGMEKRALASVSRSGELALLGHDPSKPLMEPISLSRVPMNGGAPMEIATKVTAADWAPDGTRMAVVRYDYAGDVVEFPIGKVIYRSSGLISDLRVSPTSDSVAFLDHPFRGDDAGNVKWADIHGNQKTLSSYWASSSGLAWEPSGKEVWFTASRAGAGRSLHAVTLDGKLRSVAKIPGTLHLHDISRTGRVLVARDNINMGMMGWREGEPVERDLSWFDWSRAVDVTPDGQFLLFDESGEGAGPRYATYIHKTKTGDNIRIGDGLAMAVSPDGRWAVSMVVRDPGKLLLQPIGAGEAKTLSGGGLEYEWARFFPGSGKLLISGREPGKQPRLYIQSLAGGKPQPLPGEIPASNAVLSPDGETIASLRENGKLGLYPIAGGEPRILALAEPMMPISWTTDGQWIFAHSKKRTLPTSIFRVNVQSSRAEPWKQIAPVDQEGVTMLAHVQVAQDGKSYYYSHHRNLSELFIVEGWDNR